MSKPKTFTMNVRKGGVTVNKNKKKAASDKPDSPGDSKEGDK